MQQPMTTPSIAIIPIQDPDTNNDMLKVGINSLYNAANGNADIICNLDAAKSIIKRYKKIVFIGHESKSKLDEVIKVARHIKPRKILVYSCEGGRQGGTADNLSRYLTSCTVESYKCKVSNGGISRGETIQFKDDKWFIPNSKIKVTWKEGNCSH